MKKIICSLIVIACFSLNSFAQDGGSDEVSVRNVEENIVLVENAVKKHFEDRLQDIAVWDDSEGETEGGELIVNIQFWPKPQTTLDKFYKIIHSDYVESLNAIFTSGAIVKEVELLAILSIVDKYANDRVIWVDHVKMIGDVGHKINWSRVDRILFKKHGLWKRNIPRTPSREVVDDLPSGERGITQLIQKWGLKKKEK